MQLSLAKWKNFNFHTIEVWVEPTIYSYTEKNPSGTWQFGKISFLVNFNIQKLKSKRLVCLSFLWWQYNRFFERARENILHIFRALDGTILG